MVAPPGVSRGALTIVTAGRPRRRQGPTVKGEAKRSYSPLPIRGLLQRLLHAPAVLAMLWPAVLVIGGYLAWQRWGAERISQKYYGVERSMIRVTDPPEYVKADITAAVYRDSQLDQLSLIDPAATARVASAFSAHPWVSRVIAVRKLPGGLVDVHLRYRRPVAMVYVMSRHPETPGPAFFAVDEDGVLLPTTEFTRQQTMRYPHIEIPDVYPTGGVGSGFGDPRVVAAARLAALLQPHADQLALRSIQLHDSSRTSPVPQFQLVTRDGDQHLWGSAPGQEVHGETRTNDKLAKLVGRWGAGSVREVRGPAAP